MWNRKRDKIEELERKLDAVISDSDRREGSLKKKYDDLVQTVERLEQGEFRIDISPTPEGFEWSLVQYTWNEEYSHAGFILRSRWYKKEEEVANGISDTYVGAEVEARTAMIPLQIKKHTTSVKA